jgi:hypothetical protein
LNRGDRGGRSRSFRTSSIASSADAELICSSALIVARDEVGSIDV